MIELRRLDTYANCNTIDVCSETSFDLEMILCYCSQKFVGKKKTQKGGLTNKEPFADSLHQAEDQRPVMTIVMFVVQLVVVIVTEVEEVLS